MTTQAIVREDKATYSPNTCVKNLASKEGVVGSDNSQTSSESSLVINSAFSPVAVDGLEPLTPEEESDRHRLELKVERAFYEMDKVEPKYTREIQEVSKRVAALTKYDLDPAAWSILETLNRQTCFTQFQLDLLAWIEERYGVNI